MKPPEELAKRLGPDWKWKESQLHAFRLWRELYRSVPGKPPKMLVFYPTGAGKTETMLACIAATREHTCVVVAPPSTHKRWESVGARLGINVVTMSHAKYRMEATQFSKGMPIIVDEFHLLGGHTGKGWKKFDTHARTIRAPLIIGSATPQYNDAERVYCIVHALDPVAHKGGYIHWLYQNCLTEPNPFGSTPKVTGFRNYASAEEYLASLPYVAYLEDTAPDIITDIQVVLKEGTYDPELHFELANLDLVNEKVMTSEMEKRHKRDMLLRFTYENGVWTLRPELELILETLVGNSQGSSLIFAEHSTTARALYEHFGGEDAVNIGYVDGKTSAKEKERIIQQFRDDELDVLIGTATLATGTDGLDKVCKELIIFDDITGDDALRRQLVGRILPRGIVKPEDYEGRYAHRLVILPS